ncbi:MAG: hypothetical protein ACI4B3_11105 [Prevotella sp.]
MKIIEQQSIGKDPKKKNEDIIVVTDDFIAVIDGSTSKSKRRVSLFSSNGRYAAKIIARYIRHMPSKTTSSEFCKGVTAAIARKYGKRNIERYFNHPEERLTASCIVYSRLRREVWMVGDCQCLIGDNYFDNPKPSEQKMAEMRSIEVRRLLAEGKATMESLLEHDIAREAILPQLIAEMSNQNVTYSVVDGFPIPRDKVRVIPLDFSRWTIVLASDGYPFLRPTLAESEEALAEQRRRDPLNIDVFKATKSFLPSNNSFDDRSYIRFEV